MGISDDPGSNNRPDRVSDNWLTHTLQLKMARSEKVSQAIDTATEAKQFTRSGAWELDLRNSVFRASHEVYRIFGAPPRSDSIPCGRVLNFVYTQDIDRVLDAIYQAGDYGRGSSLDFRIVGKDGIPRLLHGECAFVCDASGCPIKAYGTVQDITERQHVEDVLKESDDKFRVLAETTSGAILIMQDEHFVYANPAALRLSGYSGDEIRRLKIQDIVHPDHRDLVIGRSIARVRDENVPSQYEIKYVTKDCEVHWAVINVGVTRYNYRTALVITAFDITDRKIAEENTLASLKEKELLLKEVHHRVKNNMQIISSLLNLQSRSVKDEHDVAAFVNSQHRIRSMAIIHEMLYQSNDFSRIDLEAYTNKLVGYLFRSYGVNPGRIRSEIDVGHVSFGIDTAIPCGLIINELITNSIKYAFQGRDEGTIGLKLSIDEVNDKFVLTISDDGAGIPSDIDFDHTDTLGLSLVSTLVKQLRGSMEVERSGGTLVRIIF